MSFNAVLGSCTKIVEVPVGFGYAHHWYVQVSVLHHRVERRKDFFICQIAGRTKKHKRIRVNVIHHFPLFQSLAVTAARRGAQIFHFFIFVTPLLRLVEARR